MWEGLFRVGAGGQRTPLSDRLRWLYHRLVTGSPTMGPLSDLIRSVPDEDDVFSGDLARFRARICLREDGRCRVGIQTSDLATGAR